MCHNVSLTPFFADLGRSPTLCSYLNNRKHEA
jgi:hypothetical protein